MNRTARRFIRILPPRDQAEYVTGRFALPLGAGTTAKLQRGQNHTLAARDQL
jgi:hypothetical protein